MKYLNYPGHVAVGIGDRTDCPYFSKDGEGDTIKTWEVASVEYVDGKTRVGFEEVT